MKRACRYGIHSLCFWRIWMHFSRAFVDGMPRCIALNFFWRFFMKIFWLVERARTNIYHSPVERLLMEPAEPAGAWTLQYPTPFSDGPAICASTWWILLSLSDESARQFNQKFIITLSGGLRQWYIYDSNKLKRHYSSTISISLWLASTKRWAFLCSPHLWSHDARFDRRKIAEQSTEQKILVETLMVDSLMCFWAQKIPLCSFVIHEHVQCPLSSMHAQSIERRRFHVQDAPGSIALSSPCSSMPFALCRF